MVHFAPAVVEEPAILRDRGEQPEHWSEIDDLMLPPAGKGLRQLRGHRGELR